MSFELDGYAVYEDAGPEKGGEHTYVYCRETKRFYNCWGNHVGPKVYDAEGHLVGKKKGVSDHRQLCEATAQDLDPLSFFDTTAAKVFSGWGWLSGSGGSLGFENGKKHTATAQLYYLWTGVCHQAANRFLFWTDDYRSRPRPEKGHWPKFPPTVKKARFFHLAKLLYGYWGRDKIGKLMHEGKWEEALEFARDNFDAYERKVDPPVEQEKPEFLAALNHELRNPLNSVVGFCEVLNQTFDEHTTDMQRESVEYISSAGKHMTEITDQVLDLARMESGHIELNPESVSVDAMVKNCVGLIDIEAKEHHLTSEIEVPAPSPVIWADATRARQVLLNLLTNAVKYNHDGGHITVKVQEVPQAIRISVSDTGEGIPPERYDELFEPFNRLEMEKGNIKGSGIGLSIARKIVEAMAGRMGVESVVGEGSTFWFELPLPVVETA